MITKTRNFNLDKIIIFGLILILISSICFIIYDRYYGKTDIRFGKIISKEYRPPYTTVESTTDSKGHTSVHTVHHSASYILNYRIDGIGMRSQSVWHSTYVEYQNNEKIIVHGTIGYISGIYYVTDFTHNLARER